MVESSLGPLNRAAPLLGLGCLTLFLFALPKGPGFASPFIVWMDIINANGVLSIFEHIKDQYGPGTYLALYIATILQRLLTLDAYTAFKVVQFFFLVMSFYTALWVTHSRTLSFCFVVLMATNSVLFASLDILFTPFLILAFSALAENRYAKFATFYMIACLIKYQPLVFAPIIAAHILSDRRHGYRSISWRLALPVIALFVLTGLLFGFTWPASAMRAVDVYTSVLSAYSFNLHWLASAIFQFENGVLAANDGKVTIQTTTYAYAIACRTALVLYCGALIVAYWRTERVPANLFRFLAAMFLGYYMLNNNIHINHLHAALPPLFLLASCCAVATAHLVFWGVILSVNLLLFFVWPFDRVLMGIDVSILFSVASVAAFGLLLSETLKPALTPKHADSG